MNNSDCVIPGLSFMYTANKQTNKQNPQKNSFFVQKSKKHECLMYLAFWVDDLPLQSQGPSICLLLEYYALGVWSLLGLASRVGFRSWIRS